MATLISIEKVTTLTPGIWGWSKKASSEGPYSTLRATADCGWYKEVGHFANEAQAKAWAESIEPMPCPSEHDVTCGGMYSAD